MYFLLEPPFVCYVYFLSYAFQTKIFNVTAKKYSAKNIKKYSMLQTSLPNDLVGTPVTNINCVFSVLVS